MGRTDLSCWLALGAVLTVACSEARDDAGGGGQGGEAAGGQSEGGAVEGGAGEGAAPAGGGGQGGAPPAGDLVINEISATEDWIELFNRGTSAFDLGGIVLADDDGMGGPKLDEAISFPAGTSVAPGAFLFILAKQDAAVAPGEQAPQTACDPGSSPCFYAPFGLSDGDGDALYLLDGDAILATGEIPPAAAPEPQSWCRVPDGDGGFAVCDATPGASNGS